MFGRTGPNGTRPSLLVRLVRPWTYFAQQMGGIRIDFGQGAHQRQLTLTFNFLSGIVGLLILLTAIWSIAAGFLQSARFLEFLPTLLQARGFEWHDFYGLIVVLSVPVYILKAFAIAMLVFLAAASLGAIVGFLFGVPRPISESGPPIANASSRQAMAASVAGPGTTLPPPPGVRASAPASSGSPGWQANTNLTQISDWLTKIIVGVGLVEAYKVVGVGQALNRYITANFFEGLVGTAMIVPTLVLAGLIFGFMYSYLFTQLFLATLMARSAVEVGVVSLNEQQPDEARVLNKLLPGDPILAPSIKLVSDKQPSGTNDERATEEQKLAARRILEVPIDDLDDADSVLIWARAQAVLDQYGRAALGYSKLLYLRRTPEILSEAARVFAAAQDASYARTLIDEAVLLLPQAQQGIRARIVYDAANMALYDDPPGGYVRALTIITDDLLAFDTNGSLYILRACAKGQQYTAEKATTTNVENARRRESILQDLKTAQSKNGVRSLEWIRYLLMQASQTTTESKKVRDDDLRSFADDPDFKALIGPSPTPVTGGQQA